MRCTGCGMGVTETIPDDISRFYRDDYHRLASEQGLGYEDDAFAAEHSLAWVAALIPLLAPGGRILDIGCASGRLLGGLGEGWEKFGVEANAGMAALATGLGITVLASDLFDPRVADEMRGSVEVVTAMAVFEHLPDIRRAVSDAAGLLAHDGVMVFEVPLLGGSTSDDVWLTSSLEHIWYPTEMALTRLIRDELGLYLVGGECVIDGYGSTYVGLIARQPDRARHAADLVDRVLRGPIDGLHSVAERRVRALYEVVHAARTGTGTVALLGDLLPQDATPSLYRRLAQLWVRDLRVANGSQVPANTSADGEDQDHLGELLVAERLRSNAAVIALSALEQELAHVAQVNAVQAERQGLAEARATLAHGRPRRAVKGAVVALRALMSGVRRRQLGLGARVVMRSHARATWSESFDPADYYRRNPDVAAAGVPPALHYLLVGYREGREPSPRFSGRQYLHSNPDVAASSLNPLAHYALFGVQEGRRIVPSDRTSVPWPQDGNGEAARPRTDVRVNTHWPRAAPLVSVVIPCFNYGSYLQGALDSVLRQTWTDLEVVMVEGGSTDPASVAAFRRLESGAPPRTTFYSRDGRRLVGDNRNFGIQRTQGRYVLCLDPDDLLDPTYVEVAVFLAESYAFDLVYPSVRCFGDSDLIWLTVDARFPEILSQNLVPTVAMFRKSAWVETGGFRDWGLGADHVPEDWDFWVRILGLGYRAKSIRQPLMDYRVHPGSLNITGSVGVARHADKIFEANQELLEAWNHRAPARSDVAVINGDCNLSDPERASDTTGAVLFALPYITVGGAENLLASLARGLADRGRGVIVTASLSLPDKMPEASEVFREITPHIYDLSHLFSEDEHRRDFLMYLIGRYGVTTLVVVGSRLAYELLPEIRRRFPYIAIVDQLFNDVGHISSHREFQAEIDLTLVPSQAVLRSLVDKHGESQSHVRVIPHAIPQATTPLSEQGKAAGVKLPSDVPVVGFFGRLSEEKAPDAFVEIARKLSPISSALFVMTGDGPMRESVAKLITKYDLTSRVVTPGFVPDLVPLLDRADIVVIPSRLDGMPMIALEAMDAGKAVVASAVGSLPELIENGRTGLLCVPDDIDEFCAAIQMLLDDPGLRRRLGEAGRVAVRLAHSFDAMVERYVDVFDAARELAGSRQVSPVTPADRPSGSTATMTAP